MKKALIVQGGWEGHEPVTTAELLAAQLRQNDFEVTIANTLDVYTDPKLGELDLIVPNWTMGTIKREQLNGLMAAVESGVGLAGTHGGMGDAFRNEPDYQFMVGGQWVAHPGNDGVTYTVHITGVDSPITKDVPDFEVVSEKYYMHIDPGNSVLAVTHFGPTRMPVAWTKSWGKGRVFYLSLGHKTEVLRKPEPLTLITRGMVWAAR